MKNSIKGSVAFALLFTTLTAMANEPKIDVNPSNEAKSLVLEMDAVAGTSQLRLTDAKDNVFHYENILEGPYAKKFNLRNLENGTYYLTIENPSKKVVYTINLKNRETKITNKKESTHIPVLRTFGDRIYLNLWNGDLNTVRVKVYNGNNEEVEDQIFNGNLTVGKIYNFENALKDNYSVVVQDGIKVYRQSISVE